MLSKAGWGARRFGPWVLLIALMVSAAGDEIGVLAMIFRLAEQGQSVAVALVLIAALAPAVLLAPLTGHLVDRLDVLPEPELPTTATRRTDATLPPALSLLRTLLPQVGCYGSGLSGETAADMNSGELVADGLFVGAGGVQENADGA
jgi:hypothetical protein